MKNTGTDNNTLHSTRVVMDSSQSNDDTDVPLLPSSSSSSSSNHSSTGSTKRSLGAIGVAVVSFASVAGGPYGIEESVGAGGGLPTLLALLLTAIAWSATQALVTAELSTMMPSNAGYIAWVIRGLGPQAGFINAWNMMLSASLNIPLYPVLFASYVGQLVPSISTAGLWGVKLTGLLIVTVLNIIGVEAVEMASLIMVVLVQTPFIMMPITAAIEKQPFNWSALGQSTNWLAQFAVFISTICWNAQGWVTLGNIAAEVHNPKRSFPIGLSISVTLVAINYLYPVAVCVAMAPDTSLWQTGYFVTIAQNTATWLGYWALVGGGLSCMANFVPQMTTAARALRAAAVYDIVPIKILQRNMTRFNTPVPAILVQAVLVAILMGFSFNTLVVVQILYANIGLLLQFAAFIRLKYTDPDAVRPFAVPGKKWGAWLLTLPFAVLLGMVFYSSASGGGETGEELGIVLGTNVVLFILSYFWAKYKYRDEILQSDMVVVQDQEKEETKDMNPVDSKVEAHI